MIVPTIPGQSYAVTAAASCTVSALTPRGTTLLLRQFTASGQQILIAPSMALSLTDETACVTPTASRPALGQTSITLNETNTQQTLDQGNDNLNAHGFGILITRSGKLTQMALRARATKLPTTEPLWIKAWLLSNGTVLRYAGLSRNAVTQEPAQYGTWLFPDIPLSPQDTILFTFHETEHKDKTEWGNCGIGSLRVQAVPPAPHIGCIRTPSNPPIMYDYLPDYRIALKTQSGIQIEGLALTPLQTMRDHEENTTAHLTEQEHKNLSELLKRTQQIIELVDPPAAVLHPEEPVSPINP